MSRGASIALLGLFMACFSSAMSAHASTSTEDNDERGLTVLRTISHDPTSFTQGLELEDGVILESTGLFGHSKLRELNKSSGETTNQVEISDLFFAEGITVFEDKIVMLTWKSEVALIFDRTSFSIIGNYSFQGQGWGICYDGTHLITSNGSSELSFRNPGTFQVNHSVRVVHSGSNLELINELECVDGTIFANVWKQNHIFAINSSSGIVEYTVNASSIASNHGETINEVLNGIAYDEENDAFWLTGKNWSKLYLVQFPRDSYLENSSGISPSNHSQSSHFSDTVSLAVLSIIVIIVLRSLVYQPSPPVSDAANGQEVK
tara:strand:- start:2593 stop:3552 length:960 start_codon:yes stop_codon:yes gene_type:complete